MSHNHPKMRSFQLDDRLNDVISLTLLLFFIPYSDALAGAPVPPPPPEFQLDSQLKVNPSMAVILVCLFSVFFIMGCVSVFVRQCADRRMFLSAPENTGDSSRRTRGLDPAVVNNFPVFLYSDVKGLKIGSTALECAVCLNEFESDESLRLLPKCSHVFHPDCIDSWLACHVTCPLCRANLTTRPGEVVPGSILCQDSDTESLNSEFIDSTRFVDDVIVNIESSHVVTNIPTLTPNRNRPPRSTPRNTKETKLTRSYSASYSEASKMTNYERFTLRLPEDVRNQLMNSNLVRSKSCVNFTRIRSSRKGYRSSSVGNDKAYERFNRGDESDRRGLTKTSPFFSRTNSNRSPKVGAWDGLRVKSPFQCLGGEPSFERLKP